MQNQSSQWLSVRRDRPDYVVLYGWGALNPTAIKEAVRIGYPMDQFLVDLVAGREDDARGAGDGAKGFRELNWHAVGTAFPAIQDILKTVVEKNMSQAQTGQGRRGPLQPRHLQLGADRRRHPQRAGADRPKAVTGEDVRRGLEAIDIDAARWKALGLDGFARPIALSCADHNGHRPAFLQEWDGTKWVKVTEPITPMTDRVKPLLDAAARDYAEKNTGWPKRTEACDKPS